MKPPTSGDDVIDGKLRREEGWCMGWMRDTASTMEP